MGELLFVVGGGTMGRGIAQTAAAAGIPVVLRELNRDLAEKALESIRQSLKHSVEKGKLSGPDMRSTLDRIRVTEDLSDGSEAGIVIEAIVENLDRKKELFTELDRTVSPAGILATNTSALSISEIARVCSRPQRVIGMHFFNPVPAMKLVEIVRGRLTSEQTVAAAKSLSERMGKTPVEVRESPGFVVNRLLIPFINEAAYASSENIASRQDIDKAMMLGAGHPVGPLALADLIGIDIVVSILETLAQELGDSKYRPCPMLTDMVKARTLGRKSGKGFFDYGRR